MTDLLKSGINLSNRFVSHGNELNHRIFESGE
jgi:hypothetical protein